MTVGKFENLKKKKKSNSPNLPGHIKPITTDFEGLVSLLAMIQPYYCLQHSANKAICPGLLIPFVALLILL